MCCVVGLMFLVGPRAAVLLWWLFDAPFFRSVFATVLWPILGFIFAPWTTLFYLFASIGGLGIHGFDYVLIAIGILLDLGSYSGNAWRNRRGMRARRI